jgi:SulP family sulfate permease
MALAGILVGLVTIAVMVGAPRVTKAVPAAILGLGCRRRGLFRPRPARSRAAQPARNTLVVGALGGSAAAAAFFAGLAGRWSALAGVSLQSCRCCSSRP